MMDRGSGFGTRDSGRKARGRRLGSSSWVLGAGCWLFLGLLGTTAASQRGIAKQSAESNPSQELRIELRVYDYAGVEGSALARAQTEAVRVLQEIGIAATWVNCVVPGKDATDPQACPSADAQVPALVLHILPQAMAERAAPEKGSLGFALLADDGGPGDVAFVFYHRVASLAVELRCARGAILGYALAHEVAHLLLGTNSHSSWGIMRARWSDEDFQRMATGGFTFAPQQAQGIRARVKLRVMAQGAPRGSEFRSPE